MRRVVTVAVVLLASGCIDDLESPAEIDRPRVLALRVSPEGDPERAWPAPGETATLEWLAVEPAGRSPALEWSFVACRADPARVGADACAARPFAEVRGGAAAGEPTTTGLEVPASLDPEDTVLLRGVLCTDGEPVNDATGVPRDCTADAEATTPWRFGLELSRAGDDDNRHPALDGVTLDGEPWTASFDTACGAGAPRIDAGGEPLHIAVEAAEGALEAYVDFAGDDTRETLQVSHHATHGGFDSYFAFVDPETRSSDAHWTPPAPEELTSPETRVRFWLVVLDSRGGTTWLTRSVCVTR